MFYESAKFKVRSSDVLKALKVNFENSSNLSSEGELKKLSLGLFKGNSEKKFSC